MRQPGTIPAPNGVRSRRRRLPCRRVSRVLACVDQARGLSLPIGDEQVPGVDRGLTCFGFGARLLTVPSRPFGWLEAPPDPRWAFAWSGARRSLALATRRPVLVRVSSGVGDSLDAWSSPDWGEPVVAGIARIRRRQAPCGSCSTCRRGRRRSPSDQGSLGGPHAVAPRRRRRDARTPVVVHSSWLTEIDRDF